MARPKSIFERHTSSTLPPPDRSEGAHFVKSGEFLINIANAEYKLEEYDPDRWREIGLENGVENPFLLGAPPAEGGFQGTLLRIPAPELPDFED
jgi:nucleoid-associated protein YgaU